MSGRDDLDLKAIRRTLEEERDALAESSASTAEGRAPVEVDQQSVGRLSRMDAIQVQAMAVATEARRQERLQLIEAALGRLDDGEYGYCVRCDEDIPAKRLAVDPAVTRCVDCAGLAE
jgi:DnaK suppressor protein